MKVGIAGAGFAGVNAAEVLASEGISVTLFSAEKVLPYYRLRLPEIAFRDEEPENIIIHQQDWYDEKDIDLRLNTKVKALTKSSEIITENGTEKFDALLITTGGGPVIPQFKTESTAKNIFTLWTYEDALNIRSYINPNKEMVIIGGGIIGIEAALRARDKDLKIAIIEKMPHLMSRNFSKKASLIIETQLRDRQIDLVLDDCVKEIDKVPNDKLIVHTEYEERLTFDFAVLSLGAVFDTSLAKDAGLKTGNRIIVDKYLQTSAPGIFAAGDIADFSRPTPCSAKEAMQQGKAAGKNILAYLRGEKMQKYEVEPVPVRFKFKNFELHSIGETPATDNYLEKILDHQSMEVYRACIYEKSALAGVQMVGSSKDFMKYQKQYLLAKTWKKLKGKK
jgi:nitrite reductase (NADH) large subunit